MVLAEGIELFLVQVGLDPAGRREMPHGVPLKAQSGILRVFRPKCGDRAGLFGSPNSLSASACRQLVLIERERNTRTEGGHGSI